MEVAILATLVGMGYAVNQAKVRRVEQYPRAHVNPRTERDQTGRGKRHVDRVEKRFADESFRGGDEQAFHNNMVPFFRGSVKQPNCEALEGMMAPRLEAFTGQLDAESRSVKRSTDRLFEAAGAVEPEIDLGRFLKSYEDDHVSILRTSELPFVQTRVGPGVAGKDAHGYQQLEIDEIMRPPTVDDLRPKSSQKVTYEPPVVLGSAGSAGSAPPAKASLGKVRANRLTRYVETPVASLLATIGAFIKRSSDETFTRVDRARRVHDEEGRLLPARSAVPRDDAKRAEVAEPRRVPVEESRRVEATDATRQGRGSRDDYGRSTVEVYENDKRNASLRAVRDGGAVSLVKALVAPIVDALRPVPRKASALDAARPGLQPQIPNKSTVRDPDDVAKTTLKEPFAEAAEPLGAAKPQIPNKSTVRDPDDVAKTTLKEPFAEAAEPLGAAKPQTFKLTIYDPDRLTKTTIKETTLAQVERVGGVRGPCKLTIYDPDDVPRITIRETSDEAGEGGGGQLTGPRRPQAHDGVPLKTTVREQFSDEMPVSNARPISFKTHVYNPDDATKTTTRETTSTGVDFFLDGLEKRGHVADPADGPRTTVKEQGLFDSTFTGAMHGEEKGFAVYDPIESRPPPTSKDMIAADVLRKGPRGTASGDPRGGYAVAAADAPTTHRETQSANIRANVGERARGDGYASASVQAPESKRESLIGTERSGNATARVSAHVSYENMYSAMLSDKVDVSGRDLPFVGANQGPSVSTLGRATAVECDVAEPHQNGLAHAIVDKDATPLIDFMGRAELRPEPPRPPGPFDIARPERDLSLRTFSATTNN